MTRAFDGVEPSVDSSASLDDSSVAPYIVDSSTIRNCGYAHPRLCRPLAQDELLLRFPRPHTARPKVAAVVNHWQNDTLDQPVGGVYRQ